MRFKEKGQGAKSMLLALYYKFGARELVEKFLGDYIWINSNITIFIA